MRPERILIVGGDSTLDRNKTKDKLKELTDSRNDVTHRQSYRSQFSNGDMIGILQANKHISIHELVRGCRASKIYACSSLVRNREARFEFLSCLCSYMEDRADSMIDYIEYF